MTYHAGIGISMNRKAGEALQLVADTPHLTCDKCNLRLEIRTDRPPPAWLLDEKAPKGWMTTRIEGKRKHYCPTCKAEIIKVK
jgi:hypothetical protein